MTLIKIPVKGRAELQFWTRAFQLDDEIAQVVDKLHEDQRRKTAFVPIISEYQSGSIEWVMLLGPVVDPLGIEEGGGMVWLTVGKEHLQEALNERNKLANLILQESEEVGKFDEIIEMEPKKDV